MVSLLMLSLVIISTTQVARGTNTSTQTISDGDYILYSVTVGVDRGTWRCDFSDVTSSQLTVDVTSTIWYFGSTHNPVLPYSYENNMIKLPVLNGGLTAENKVGDSDIHTIYGEKHVNVYSYWDQGPYSRVQRTYVVPFDCLVQYKYYGNDTDGNHVEMTLQDTNIAWLKDVGGSEHSSLSVTETLLGAGANWTANGGTKALFIDTYDNWVIHGSTDGVDWNWWWGHDGMLKERLSISNALQKAGLNVTFAGDIPQNLSGYDVVVISAYYSCEPSDSAQIRSYIAGGGGVVLIGAVPEFFRCYTKYGGYGIPTDPLSVSNPDWLGFTGYENAGGDATLAIDHPFGTELMSGDVMLSSTAYSYASVTGANGTIIGVWQSGQVSACSHEFGQGRLYYQAIFIGTQNLPPTGHLSGKVVSQFGYGLGLATITIDGGDAQGCDAGGNFMLELSPGNHNATFAAWGHDPITIQITIRNQETLDIGSIQLTINNSAMGLIRFTAPNGQSLLAPEGWTHSVGVSVGGMKVDLCLNGTVFNGLTTNVVIGSGSDLQVREDAPFLQSMMDSTISELRGLGMNISLLDSPVFRSIDNHTGIIFSLYYHNYPMIQQQAFVVDEAHHRLWVIDCTISDQEYMKYKPMFDQMIASFSTVDQVTGTVATEFGYPLSGAMIRADGGQIFYSADDGQFVVSGIIEGSHEFEFIHDGYQNLTRTYLVHSNHTIDAGIVGVPHTRVAHGAQFDASVKVAGSNESSWWGSDLAYGHNGLYIVSWDASAGGIRLFKSNDGGMKWSNGTTLATYSTPTIPRLCVSNNQENDQIIVIMGSNGTILKSNDNGTTFTRLSNLPLPSENGKWIGASIGTNASWHGGAQDQDVYVAGYTVDIIHSSIVIKLVLIKSHDGGIHWGNPTTISEFNGGLYLDLVGDGDHLYLFYTALDSQYQPLGVYIRESSDWGQTWSLPNIVSLKEGTGTWMGNVQYLDKTKALITMEQEYSKNGTIITNPIWGYFYFSNQTFVGKGYMVSQEWPLVSEGFFSGHLLPNGTFAISASECSLNDYASSKVLSFATSRDSGLTRTKARITGLVGNSTMAKPTGLNIKLNGADVQSNGSGGFGALVDEGQYNVTISAPGYHSRWFQVKAAWGEEIDLSRITLERHLCTISGTLQDSSGKSISNASVLLDGSPMAHTDSSGHFSLQVNEGRHSLTMAATGYDDRTQTVNATWGGDIHLEAITMQQPSSSDWMLFLIAGLGAIVAIIGIALVWKRRKGADKGPPQA